MKIQSLTVLTLACLVTAITTLLSADVRASDTGATEASQPLSQPLSQAEYEAMVEAAEVARMEAQEAAGQAREMSRQRTELAEEKMQATREQREELAQQSVLQKEEAARMREELSRTHRELREVSREVARAHRELSMLEDQEHQLRLINLGDRAVIGVILGPETPNGVQLMGVSPDGPAERAGLQQGDILMSISGVDLADHGRAAINEVMNEVSAGEELLISMIRDDEIRELTVTAELREPRAWQSLIRIPEVDDAATDSPRMVIKHIEIPEIDEVALAAEIAEMEKKVQEMEYVFITEDGEHHSSTGDFEIEFQEISRMGEHAMREANVWFGMPHAQGFELSAVNPGLGEYFNTDRGVLVIKAREDNDYTLQSGDVVLEINSILVDTPADMMRALRAIASGSEIEMEIKRDRRSVSLTVVMPENRFSHNASHFP